MGTNEAALDGLANDEAALVARAKRREPSAWDEIFEAHYSRLYRYCFARVGSEADALDLASNVFLKAVEGIDG